MTSWWNKNSEFRMKDFITWVGDHDQPSKIYCRGYISGREYKSILDCGCGLSSEFFGFKSDNYEIDYTGLDSCSNFVRHNKEKNIKMVESELEDSLPLPDNSYDVVYSREVIEHLSYYEKTINEMIRVASKEVLIIWFIIPDKENVNYWEEEDLYHNMYDKGKLEAFILNNGKVKNIKWKFINDQTNRKDVVDELEKAHNSTDENAVVSMETAEDIPPNDIVNEIASEEIVEKSAETISGEIDAEKPWVKTPKAILHIMLK